MKPGGFRPVARSGVSVAVAQNGKAYIFGGVLDDKEDEESLSGQFCNEMHSLELSNPVWRLIELSGKKEKKAGKSKSDDSKDVEEMETAAQTSHGVFNELFF